MIVAIDGPAASGKSTVSKAVARALEMPYLDTGAMYRAVTALALTRGLSLDDAETLTALALAHPVEFSYAGDPVPTAVMIDGLDVTEAIRTPEVDAAVSAVARVPGVRSALVARQRELVDRNAVVEGRDIGTVVFPLAPVKVFLDASAEERARRRHVELNEAGHGLGNGVVREGIARRDAADSSREASPLRAADDAYLLDTTGLSIDEVVSQIVALVRERSA
jgi:cytidylate kinase